MIDSIFINKGALISLSIDFINKTIKLFVPNNSEFDLIEDLCLILKPIKQLTVSLSGRDYITISILFPFIYNLVNFQLKNINLKIEDVRAVKDELIESLNKRFLYIFQTDIFLAFTFLDFRFKKFEFIKNQNERVSYLEKA